MEGFWILAALEPSESRARLLEEAETKASRRLLGRPRQQVLVELDHGIDRGKSES
jgi:hypothetical protein